MVKVVSDLFEGRRFATVEDGAARADGFAAEDGEAAEESPAGE